MQVTVDGAVLQAWLSDHGSAPGVPLPADQQLHSLRMFATNDYLGLSTHVRVRQAAADAAMKHGSGDACALADRWGRRCRVWAGNQKMCT